MDPTPSIQAWLPGKSAWSQMLHLASAYAEAADVLCKALAEEDFTQQYTSAMVIRHLCRHAVELFNAGPTVPHRPNCEPQRMERAMKSNTLEVSRGSALTVLVPILAMTLIGCEAKYKEGYQAGYAQGSVDTEVRLREKFEQELADAKRSEPVAEPSYSSSTSTTVCGGNGVTFNGKHYGGGKTGCVDVFSDGRVVRY